MKNNYDRAAEDLGNSVGLEHVNLKVPDQRLATLFYINGLGMTRDPYLVTGVVNMWINVGRSQFHLPVGDAQVFRGRIGLVVPDLGALKKRLGDVRKPLARTRFSFKAGKGHVDVTCPWGNQIRCHAPSERFGRLTLGMPYLQIDVPPGTAAGIARFYDQIIKAPAKTVRVEGARAARVLVGNSQTFIFRELKKAPPKYDGHHIQLYVADFSGPHAELAKRGLVTEESNQHQYRFLDIIDPDDGKLLYQFEHEIRSMTHPLYARPLINRNPSQTNNEFAPGHDDQPWAMAYGG